MGMQLPLIAIRRQIASGIDILVHLGRGGDGSRRVEEIAQIVGMEGEEVRIVPLYRWDGEHGLTKKTDLFAGKKE
ncbi:MAG: hypothetical protein ACI4EG_12950 [Fusicatenibacter sp.]